MSSTPEADSSSNHVDSVDTESSSQQDNLSTDSDSSIGLDNDSDSTPDEEDDKDLLDYDPTPRDNPYPSPQWHTWSQLFHREYGKSERPGTLKKRRFSTNPYNPHWFSRYAYDSLYFIRKMKRNSTLSGHLGCVNCVNFNSTGNLLCSGSDDRNILIWDWSRKKLLKTVTSGHTLNIFQSLWCLNDSHIVTGSRDGQVRIFDVHNPLESSKRLVEHRGAVHKTTFSSPQVLMSCGEDAAVFEIDLRTNISNRLFVLRSERKHLIPLYSIDCNMVFTPNYFAVAGRGPLVRIYDRRFIRKDSSQECSSSRQRSHSSSSDDSTENEPTFPSPVMQLCAKELEKNNFVSVSCAVYNSTGNKILISYNDDDLYVFNTLTGEQEGKYQGHRNHNTVKKCSWFSDNFVMSGSDEGNIFCWDRVSGHIVWFGLGDSSGSVNCIDCHPTLPLLASSGLDDDIKIWTPTEKDWPVCLTGIKKKICENVRDRKKASKKGRQDGYPIIWLVLQNLRQNVLERASNRRDEDSESMDEDEPPDSACMPS